MACALTRDPIEDGMIKIIAISGASALTAF
jgi:hypothetical protein